MSGSEARMIATWQAPLPSGGASEELLVRFDQGRQKRVLILPALFDEANKLRRFTIEAMRALDAEEIDSCLPDLPGCNESLVPLETQTLESWKSAAQEAAKLFSATHVLAIRAGALLTPTSLPGWHYAPQTGAKLLRALTRARIIAASEAGKTETSEQLLELGRSDGLMLAGWQIGSSMIRELETALPPAGDNHSIIAPAQLGGAGLWLRAEPGEDQAQSQALAAIVASSAETEA